MNQELSRIGSLSSGKEPPWRLPAGQPIRFNPDMGNRIAELRERKGWSQRQLADATGTTSQQIGRLEAGKRRLDQGWLTRLSDALMVSPAEILGEEVRAPAASALESGLVEIDRVPYVSIARYDARLSAGPGAIVDPNAEPLGHHLIEQQWLNALTRAAPSHLAVLQVDGDSMEDTLADRDWVLVDRTQRRLNREGIYALQVGDATWVKRVTLNLREKLVQIISDNPRYPLQELEEEEIVPIGRVIWVVGRKL